MATVYEINKGINRSIEFRGIKAQYIMYMAAGMVALLLLFAILYVSGLKIYYCLGIVIPGGAAFLMTIQHLSNTYGENGLKRRLAARQLPSAITSQSRKPFIQLQQSSDEKK